MAFGRLASAGRSSLRRNMGNTKEKTDSLYWVVDAA
jgi:hypothetical protein